MNEMYEVTAGLQCCLLCGRTLTDRTLHDRLEEPIIAAISREHRGWAGADETCARCVSAYRELLDGRLTRAARLDAARVERGWRARINRFLSCSGVGGAEVPRAATSRLEGR